MNPTPTAPMAALAAPELQAPLSLHTYFRDIVQTIPASRTEDGKDMIFQDIALGIGNIMVGMIHGEGYDANDRKVHGYPKLTIFEARALAADLIALWNNRERVANALRVASDALRQGIEYSGHKVAGPGDHLAAEDEEPAWVCNARAAIAEVHAALKLNAEGVA